MTSTSRTQPQNSGTCGTPSRKASRRKAEVGGLPWRHRESTEETRNPLPRGPEELPHACHRMLHRWPHRGAHHPRPGPRCRAHRRSRAAAREAIAQNRPHRGRGTGPGQLAAPPQPRPLRQAHGPELGQAADPSAAIGIAARPASMTRTAASMRPTTAHPQLEEAIWRAVLGLVNDPAAATPPVPAAPGAPGARGPGRPTATPTGRPATWKGSLPSWSTGEAATSTSLPTAI